MGGGLVHDSVSSVTFDPEGNKTTNEGSRLDRRVFTCLPSCACRDISGFKSFVSVET